MQLDGILVEPVWYDSLGAKSSSVYIEKDGCRLLVDPGVAVMHKGFPASAENKILWYREGRARILEKMRSASVIVITHYHHDHYLHKREDISLYLGKTVIAKNPNQYINESQRMRALNLFQAIYEAIGAGFSLESSDHSIGFNFDELEGTIEQALSSNFGDYMGRRRELLEKGRAWLETLAAKWMEWPRVQETRKNGTAIYWGDGKEYNVECFKLRFTYPLFHGVEYSRLGWVIALVIEANGKKIMYSSDVNGPIIEDYAILIEKENPDILFLDGPPTYLLGYTLNKINLRRAVENMLGIIENTSRLKLVVYDHHLTREPRYKERTKEVWVTSRKTGVIVTTAAELLGLKPAVLRGI